MKMRDKVMSNVNLGVLDCVGSAWLTLPEHCPHLYTKKLVNWPLRIPFPSKSLTLVHQKNVKISLTLSLAGNNGWMIFPKLQFSVNLGIFDNEQYSPSKSENKKNWGGHLKLHSIHIYVLKWKPEPWFLCLGAWLSSDRVPDWSMACWPGAWLHSVPLYSASSSRESLGEPGGHHAVWLIAASLSLYHAEAQWASAERQEPQNVIYTTASFYWDEFNSQFSLGL